MKLFFFNLKSAKFDFVRFITNYGQNTEFSFIKSIMEIRMMIICMKYLSMNMNRIINYTVKNVKLLIFF